MRRAVGLGSLTKMSWSILHGFVYMRCRGIEEYIGGWGSQVIVSRTGLGEGFTNQYRNGDVLVKE